MDKLSIICLVLALCGLLLVFFFSPSKAFAERTPFELLHDCFGKVKVSGTVSNFFYTKTGKPVVEMNGLLVLLEESELENTRITVFGKASLHDGKCWLIAESVEHA